MKPLVAAGAVSVALAVGAQAQTPEAAKARKTAELRKAAELGWAVMRALRNLYPVALRRLRRIALEAARHDQHRDRVSRALRHWATRYNAREVLGTASALARSWELKPEWADRLLIVPVLPLVPDLRIPTGTDKRAFLDRAAKLYDSALPMPSHNRNLERQIAIFVLRRMKGLSVAETACELGDAEQLDESTIRKAEKNIAALLTNSKSDAVSRK